MSAPAEDDGEALLAILREAIRRDGPIGVERYIQMCLADPQHGYWAKPRTIGAGGDFITAPEIAQAFGELIGLWCAVVWQGMGRPSPLRLVELGPGRGTLMRDALRAAQRVPDFLDAVTVHLIETSAPLREMQRSLLPPPSRGRAGVGGGHDASGVPPPRKPSGSIGSARVSGKPEGKGEGNCNPIAWHANVSQVPDGAAIVIANEFLDALPIRQLVHADGAWRERTVALDETGALRFAVGESADAGEVGPIPTPGAILELRAGEDELLAELGRRAAPITALFIDYGPAEPAYGDTLQAVRRHTYVDPLAAPGCADLTAHVHFTSLARKARQAGLAADGPITQASFLGALGIAERTARLMADNPDQAGALEAATQRLVSPTGMGSLFKVLAVRTPHLPPPPPFV
jgi:NADH dehydrogenase [ubiquinone] 1 alpha subcomplex assembly factor 7